MQSAFHPLLSDEDSGTEAASGNDSDDFHVRSSLKIVLFNDIIVRFR